MRPDFVPEGASVETVVERPSPGDAEPERPTSRLAELAASRHRAVADPARWLVVNPALKGAPAGGSWLFEDLACKLLEAVHGDDPELTRSLVLLTQAKDAAVRAKLVDG